MSFNARIPYNDLPLLMPDPKLWKTIPVLEQANLANKALAELKGRMSAIPNPNIFINTLNIQEAKESSAIENVVTTDEKLYRAMTSKYEPDRATKEVLRYGHAVNQAYDAVEKSDQVTLDILIDLYRTIKGETDGIRDFKVHIGTSFEIIYTPPCCQDVLEKMLDNFLDVAAAKDDVDPLIKMAILHYQFESIHPFKDGNGRTGRVLNILYLYIQKLLDEPVLYLSKYINEYKQGYYTGLRGVTERQDWETWVLYMLRAVEQTSKYTLNKVLAIIQLFHDSRRWMQQTLPDVYSHELLEVLFTHVYCKYAYLEQEGIASRNTASKYLNRLTDEGFLAKEKVGNELIFRNIQLYELLRGGSIS